MIAAQAAPATLAVDARWLKRGELARLIAALDGGGEEARVVGGAVRNHLLGEPIRDIDIATTAHPREATRRASALGFRTVPTGLSHGTVTAVGREGHYEITTLRTDVETHGRRATVAFGRDWAADARRRDFTINALSLSADGTVHDYVGGLADIPARRIRFIGDPAARIAEDYLRILRFFRFHAAYGDGRPDGEGLAACVAARHGLLTLSRERVRDELLKIMRARHVLAAVEVMADTGLLTMLTAGVPALVALSRLIEIEAGGEPDPVLRLGALCLMVDEDAGRLAERLRLSNRECARLASMVERWWDCAPGDERGARARLYRLGPERFRDRVMFAWARGQAMTDDARWRDLADLPARWAAPVFPLKAADLLARGIGKGPALGAALREAERRWIESGFAADPASLAAIADATASSPAADAGGEL